MNKKDVSAIVSGGDIFRLQVNYNLRLEAAIEAGKYDQVSNDINAKNFSTKRAGQHEVKLKLFHFNKETTSEEVISEMDKQGYRPAELPELLAFGAKHPKEQRKYPIIALGSVWQNPYGYRYVPYLRRNASERELFLDWIETDWYTHCRFVAINK